MKLPSIFISHGTPGITVNVCPVRSFLQQLGSQFDRPRAIVCISAHWETVRPAVTGTAHPETIHDFGGFSRLRRFRYPALGDLQVAEQVIACLKNAGMDGTIDPSRGLDHGVWVPLALMYPDADIPVVQVSLQPDMAPEHHVELGRSLAILRENGILILGSGGATHDLGAVSEYAPDSLPPDYARTFDAWLEEAVTANDMEKLIRFRYNGPAADKNHPWPSEHFLPLLVAAGAANGPGKLIHRSFMFGVLSMSAFRWD